MFTVYKTTNLINKKIYIGVHKTTNPNDGYLGSGNLLRKAIEKYGVGNFQKEVLFEFDDRESAYAKERELVDHIFIKSDANYNIKIGGYGGSRFGRPGPMAGKTHTDATKKKLSEHNLNKTFSEETRKKLSVNNWANTNRENHKNHVRRINLGKPKSEETRKKLAKANTGNTHTDATKKKMSTARLGVRRSDETRQKISAAMTGKSCWVCNEQGPIKIKIEYLQSYLSDGWVRGRTLGV